MKYYLSFLFVVTILPMFAQFEIDTFYCDKDVVFELPNEDSVYSIMHIREDVILVFDYDDSQELVMKRSYNNTPIVRSSLEGCQDPEGMENGEFCWYEDGRLTDREFYQPWLYKTQLEWEISRFDYINWLAVERKNGSLSIDFYKSGEVKSLVFYDRDLNYIGYNLILSKDGNVKKKERDL